jgi:hypothetical protein
MAPGQSYDLRARSYDLLIVVFEGTLEATSGEPAAVEEPSPASASGKVESESTRRLKRQSLGPLSAQFVPAGTPFALRNTGDSSSWHAAVQFHAAAS